MIDLVELRPIHSNARLSVQLGKFLVALAGSSVERVTDLSAEIGFCCQMTGRGIDHLVMAADAAAALYVGRHLADAEQRETWTKALVAVETILENELARLDRAAPAAEAEAAG